MKINIEVNEKITRLFKLNDGMPTDKEWLVFIKPYIYYLN